MTVDPPARRRSLIRGVAAGQAVLAGVLIARPRAAARWMAGRRHPRIPVGLARALGARLAVQAVAELAYPVRPVARASAAVDLTHALSMLIPAGLDRRYRRAAAINAATSTVSATLLAGAARPTPLSR